jgi:hypothetical protein
VTYYLDELKRLGVYEDATIIITADHGIWWETDPNAEPWLSSPLMLVKPAGVSEGDLTTSDAQVEAYDVLPTVIASKASPLIGANSICRPFSVRPRPMAAEFIPLSSITPISRLQISRGRWR